MMSMNRTPYVLGLALVLLTCATSVSSPRTVGKKHVLNCPVDENTAVRFFYNNETDYFHFPLIFRPVAQGDPRLNTAPTGKEGRTAYISLAEMRELIQGLAHSGLSWQESEKVEPLGSFKRLTFITGNEIRVVWSKGTATAEFDPKRICQTLEPLDSALKTPRAVWEFQGFRLGDGCRVPGFKYGAYPDHYFQPAGAQSLALRGWRIRADGFCRHVCAPW